MAIKRLVVTRLQTPLVKSHAIKGPTLNSLVEPEWKVSTHQQLADTVYSENGVASLPVLQGERRGMHEMEDRLSAAKHNDVEHNVAIRLGAIDGTFVDDTKANSSKLDDSLAFS
jgi:hypothetical protein